MSRSVTRADKILTLALAKRVDSEIALPTTEMISVTALSPEFSIQGSETIKSGNTEKEKVNEELSSGIGKY